jgi:D-alanine-D-alanine ligase
MALKKLRVLALMHVGLVPPADATSREENAEWKTEFDVLSTLRAIGHEVMPLGIHDDLGVIRKAIDEWKPHVAFNLLEDFDGVPVFDMNVVSYLEVLRIPYTGCNPRGLMLARDKALSKKILAYHRIAVPEFAVFPIGRVVRPSKRLTFPLIVKSLTKEASEGISQASVVDDVDKLAERVKFIHRNLGTDAIVERYVDGRELYVGVMGNQRLRVLPVWEMLFTNMPPQVRRIATNRVKWSHAYQQKHGITSEAAKDLPPAVMENIAHLCRRIYRTLSLTGYARLDFRLGADGRMYVLEANPNPQLANGEDFADSAARAGMSYGDLLQAIINLALARRTE